MLTWYCPCYTKLTFIRCVCIYSINYLFNYLFNTGGTQNTVSKEHEMNRKCYSTIAAHSHITITLHDDSEKNTSTRKL